MKYKTSTKVENDIIPDFVSDDYFSTQSLKNAVWQYMLDHANVNGSGTMKIVFILPTESEFWRRVKARESGEYHRNDLRKLREKEDRRFREFSGIKDRLSIYDELEKHRIKNCNDLNNLRTSGNLYQKFCVILQKYLYRMAKRVRNVALKSCTQ
jgi:hypothetical protein